jgi:TRAP-type C4-dicarboxylate transport system substrate-binding protein
MATALVAAQQGARAQETTLRAINFLGSPKAAFSKPFFGWVEGVNERGKGLVQIEVLAGGSMSPFEMGNAVRTGAVDLANLPATFYQNLLPIGDAMKLSQVGPAERRRNGAWELMNKLHNERVNAHYLGSWGDGVPFHLYLREKRISEPDLSGLKLRITPVYRAFFRSLGADLIQTPPADVYTALERGAIDGYGWPIWDIKTFGWDKVTAYRVDPGFYQVAVALIVNLDKWKSLSDKQRDFLTEEANRFIDEFPKTAAKENARYAEEQAEAGVEVIEFTGKTAERYLEQAYEAGWEEAIKLDPVNGPKLREMLSK